MDKTKAVMATPLNGRRIRKPDGTLLAAGGERVTQSSYWLRREKDGDVMLSPIEPPARATDKAKA